MADSANSIVGTYRCPVCGHSDSIELPVSDESTVIACSYCETPLEVAARGADSVRFSVQVASEPTVQ